MPLRILRMLANALQMKEYTTYALRNPLPMFRCVTFIRQAILNSQDCFIHSIYFDSFTVTIWIPDCYLFLIELLLICFGTFMCTK